MESVKYCLIGLVIWLFSPVLVPIAVVFVTGKMFLDIVDARGD